jgi:hypothetical protein
MTPRQAISKDWTRHLTGGPLGIGLDLATTANKKSNPSALVVSQQEGNRIIERLVISWKTMDDRVTKAVLRAVCDDIQATKRRPRGIAVDASNEVFLCRQIKREFSAVAPVHLIAGGASVTFKGIEYTFKVLLGNLYAGLYEDGLISHPDCQWIIDDRRLVQREKGTFKTDLGPNGEHGDTFDGGKLAYWTLTRKGRAEIHAASTSSSPATGANLAGVTSHLKNFLAKRFGLKGLPNRHTLNH